MNFFSKLRLVFAYGDELEEMLKHAQEDTYLASLVAKAHHLNLCSQHRQEEKHSHYATHNCDYCKALKGIVRPVDMKSLDTWLK